jgi:hypothetical protein
MHRPFTLVTMIAVGVLTGACSTSYSSGPQAPPVIQATIVTASGAIGAKVDEFRGLLGQPNNGGTAGEQAAGRREISWDGAGANPFDNRNDFPGTFFNTNVKAGALLTTPGTGFRNDSTKFVDINPTYAAEFNTFSPTKIFSPVGSNVMDVSFQVAGQPTPARVTGFGAVFSDVDVADGTTIEFFDNNGYSLGKISAPVRSDASGLSFAGAKFATGVVARVRITLGTGSLSATAKDISAGGQLDLVVVDDFIYGEPKLLP